MSKPRIDMAGKVVGHLTVLKYVGPYHRLIIGGRKRGAMWLCRCKCGRKTIVRGNHLRYKAGTRSCGCTNPGNTQHGLYGTKVYELFCAAKYRARINDLEFDLTLEDIVIPNRCPVLDIPLRGAVGKASANSPSIDRLDGSRGYTSDNIRVISYRANTIKNNATLEELLKIVNYVRSTTNEGTLIC